MSVVSGWVRLCLGFIVVNFIGVFDCVFLKRVFFEEWVELYLVWGRGRGDFKGN